MSGFLLWVKDVFLVILSFLFFQVLIPDSEISKYVRFIFSLILLVIILTPIIKLLE